MEAHVYLGGCAARTAAYMSAFGVAHCGRIRGLAHAVHRSIDRCVGRTMDGLAHINTHTCIHTFVRTYIRAALLTLPCLLVVFMRVCTYPERAEAVVECVIRMSATVATGYYGCPAC
eukprot:GHVU01029325.1.p1 GENE.GHVU01029325.1~~GHVU01029325.1.p1  ORF type:complete len:117 (-),score=0.70 GHVU01029325.1:277-627(-)